MIGPSGDWVCESEFAESSERSEGVGDGGAIVEPACAVEVDVVADAGPAFECERLLMLPPKSDAKGFVMREVVVVAGEDVDGVEELVDRPVGRGGRGGFVV